MEPSFVNKVESEGIWDNCGQKENLVVLRRVEIYDGGKYRIAAEFYFDRDSSNHYFLLEEKRYAEFLRNFKNEDENFKRFEDKFKYYLKCTESYLCDRFYIECDGVLKRFIQFLDKLLEENMEFEIFNVTDNMHILQSMCGNYRKIKKEVYENVTKCKVGDSFKPFTLIRQLKGANKFQYFAHSKTKDEIYLKEYKGLETDEKKILTILYSQLKEIKI